MNAFDEVSVRGRIIGALGAGPGRRLRWRRARDRAMQQVLNAASAA